MRDLTGRNSLDLRGRRALLLGAGGAARGVAPALLDAGVDELVIVNRSPERADALADAPACAPSPPAAPALALALALPVA
ncbi:Shikimate dehydrogenase (NADP(+)) [compost metagenome]